MKMVRLSKITLVASVLTAGGCTHSPTGDVAQGASGVFQCLDGNGNGYLETGELRHTSACGSGETFAERGFPSENGGERAEAVIEAMDVDRDERVSSGEFSAWYGR